MAAATPGDRNDRHAWGYPESVLDPVARALAAGQGRPDEHRRYHYLASQVVPALPFLAAPAETEGGDVDLSAEVAVVERMLRHADLSTREVEATRAVLRAAQVDSPAVRANYGPGEERLRADLRRYGVARCVLASACGLDLEHETDEDGAAEVAGILAVAQWMQAEQLADALGLDVDSVVAGGDIDAANADRIAVLRALAAPAETEATYAIEGRDETCPSCQATVGTSLAYVLDEHTSSIEDGPGSENPPTLCGSSEVAVHHVLAASPPAQGPAETEAGDFGARLDDEIAKAERVRTAHRGHGHVHAYDVADQRVQALSDVRARLAATPPAPEGEADVRCGECGQPRPRTGRCGVCGGWHGYADEIAHPGPAGPQAEGAGGDGS